MQRAVAQGQVSGHMSGWIHVQHVSHRNFCFCPLRTHQTRVAVTIWSRTATVFGRRDAHMHRTHDLNGSMLQQWHSERRLMENMVRLSVPLLSCCWSCSLFI